MRQIIFAMVIIGVLLGGGFFAYRTFTAVPGAGVVGVSSEREARLAEYRKIKTLRLDLSILSDPFLRSFSRPLPAATSSSITLGRKNPFAQ